MAKPNISRKSRQTASKKDSSEKRIDWDLLSELIHKARGGRSLRQYAIDADVDPSIISRILSKDYVPGIKVLEKLTSQEASPQGNVTLKDFLYATGYNESVTTGFSSLQIDSLSKSTIETGAAFVNKLLRLDYNKGDNEIHGTFVLNTDIFQKFDKTQSRFHAIAIGIIYRSLALSGIIWHPGNPKQLEELSPSPHDYITCEGQSISEWWFIFYAANDLLDNDNVLSSEYSVEIMIGLFIGTPADKTRKLSIVVDDEKLFTAIVNLKNHNSYRGNLSAILIDTENICIVKEETIALYDETITENDIPSFQ